MFIVVSLKNFVPSILNYFSIHNIYLFHILSTQQVFVEIMQNKVNGIIQLCVVLGLSTPVLLNFTEIHSVSIFNLKKTIMRIFTP